MAPHQRGPDAAQPEPRVVARPPAPVPLGHLVHDLGLRDLRERHRQSLLRRSPGHALGPQGLPDAVAALALVCQPATREAGGEARVVQVPGLAEAPDRLVHLRLRVALGERLPDLRFGVVAPQHGRPLGREVTRGTLGACSTSSQNMPDSVTPPGVTPTTFTVGLENAPAAFGALGFASDDEPPAKVK